MPKKEKSVYHYIVVALIVAIMDGILVYALSMELSSNQYYSTTQFATLYTTCISFLGQGIGAVLFAKLFKVTEKSISLSILWWILAILLTAFCVFRVFPDAMLWVNGAKYSNEIVAIGDGVWLKVLISGGVELPVFLVAGMVDTAIFSYIRERHVKHIPALAALSTLGAAFGYILGIFIPDVPGINTVFLWTVVILLFLVIDCRAVVRVGAPLIVMVLSVAFNFDQAIEQFRSPSNQVYATTVKGTVVGYDWSRLQKSEYVLSGEGENEKISLVLNGAMQVMASRSSVLVRNLGYELIYNSEFVKDKNVLIVGGGMGRGALLAYNNGAKKIDVVDIEPSLMGEYGLYKEYCQDIYSKPNVNFYVMDGRMALHELADTKYDLVVFEGVINQAAVYSLNITTEGYLYTAQAVQEALALLDEKGVFVNFTISADKTVESYNTQYSDQSEAYLKKYIYAFVEDSASGLNYYVSLSGMSRDPEKMDQFTANFVSTEGIKVSDITVRDLTDKSAWPITDDRPFPHISRPADVLFEAMFAIGFVVLAFAVCAHGIKKKAANIRYMQFALLGAAMMMIELYIINKLGFFLNDSMMSYSVGTAIFLLAFAVGNANSMRLKFTARTFIPLFLVALLLFAGVLNSPVKTALIIMPWALRLLASIVLIAPLAFLCGTFFPRLLVTQVQDDTVAASMGYVKFLDALGVGAGFFLFNYIACIWGYNYVIPFVALLYGLEAMVCYRKGKA